MKQTISILLFATILYSCGNSNQNKAEQQATQIQSAIKPCIVATTASGYTMTSKINSSNWVASSMMSPDNAGRIVGYYENDNVILPYSKSEMVAGRKIMIGEDNAVGLSLMNGCLYTNPINQIEITKVAARQKVHSI